MDNDKSKLAFKHTSNDSSRGQTDRGLVFESLKENREGYFVEYLPARASAGLATLSLVFVEQPSNSEIVRLMELECRSWILRYPVALFVGATDDETDTVIHPCDDENVSYLLGFPSREDIELHWCGRGSPPIPIAPISDARLIEVYDGIPHSTLEERRRRVEKDAQAFRIGWFLVVAWLVGGPLMVQLIGFSNPLLGIVQIMYSIFKAISQARKMLGYTRKSDREKAKEADEARMRHHHYHCELNPEGFARLKHENFVRETKEQTIQEKRDLETKANDTSRES